MQSNCVGNGLTGRISVHRFFLLSRQVKSRTDKSLTRRYIFFFRFQSECVCLRFCWAHAKHYRSTRKRCGKQVQSSMNKAVKLELKDAIRWNGIQFSCNSIMSCMAKGDDYWPNPYKAAIFRLNGGFFFVPSVARWFHRSLLRLAFGNFHQVLCVWPRPCIHFARG